MSITFMSAAELMEHHYDLSQYIMNHNAWNRYLTFHNYVSGYETDPRHVKQSLKVYEKEKKVLMAEIRQQFPHVKQPGTVIGTLYHERSLRTL